MAAPNKQMRSYWNGGVLNFFDEILHPEFRNGVWSTCPIKQIKSDPSLGTVYIDDMTFCNDAGGHSKWTESGDAQVIAIADGANGQLSLQPDDGTIEHAATIATNGESWLCSSGKELWFEAGVILTEANTDDANILIGLCDSPGADVLQDAGAGPPDDYDGLVFFKVLNGTVWQFETSNATSQDPNTDVGDFTSGALHRVGFHFDGTATTGVVTPYLDDVVATAVSVTLSAFGAMEFVASVKNGGGNRENLLIDYVKIVQLR